MNQEDRVHSKQKNPDRVAACKKLEESNRKRIYEIHNQGIASGTRSLEYIEKFKTQEMCLKAVASEPWMIKAVPYEFITQKMCDMVIAKDPTMIEYVPEKLKTQEINKGSSLKDFNKQFLLGEVKIMAFLYGGYSLARLCGNIVLYYIIVYKILRGGGI